MYTEPQVYKWQFFVFRNDKWHFGSRLGDFGPRHFFFFFFVHDRFPVDLENSRNKQSPKEIENKSKKVKDFTWEIYFKIMDF